MSHFSGCIRIIKQRKYIMHLEQERIQKV